MNYFCLTRTRVRRTTSHDFARLRPDLWWPTGLIIIDLHRRFVDALIGITERRQNIRRFCWRPQSGGWRISFIAERASPLGREMECPAECSSSSKENLLGSPSTIAGLIRRRSDFLWWKYSSDFSKDSARKSRTNRTARENDRIGTKCWLLNPLVRLSACPPSNFQNFTASLEKVGTSISGPLEAE